jgi:hemin uptake protein HemP
LIPASRWRAFLILHGLLTLSDERSPTDLDVETGELSRPGADELRTLRSEELLQGANEVLIAHGSQVYRLRLTRTGKLILQK